MFIVSRILIVLEYVVYSVMLKALYSKMIHVTCAAHGLHRVAEEIRGQFKSVDKLIASVKKNF